MRSAEHSSQDTPLPRLPLALLRVLLPGAERDEVFADIAAEYREYAAVHGLPDARRWLWGQALRSTPALLRLNWWRSWTGFEPRANAFRPGGHVLKNWTTDARYAARRLVARPSYTILSILTLALGIGGTAAVFGIARPLIFDPLPYANTGEVLAFWMPGWWNEEEFLFLRGNNHFSGFRSVAAVRPGDVTMREGDAPARLLAGLTISHELFDVLGARPFLGRTTQPGDDAQGAEPVAVLSYGLWQELGGTPAVIGKRLTLDGTERTVVGVMPRGFWFPDPSIRIWLPRALDPQGRNGSYAFYGRVAPGQDPGNMGAHVARFTKTLGERFTYSIGGDKTRDPQLTPLREQLLGKMKPAILATFVAMGLILLIACVNVAALMLGQVEGRSSEMAVRSALGATRGRLTQQLVIEALILGVGAGLVGAGLAAYGFRLLAGALPIGAWSEAAAFDWTLFGVALAIAIGAVLLVVLVPSVSLWRGDLRGILSSSRMGGVQGRGGRLEQGLVVAEVALAMLIASGAALLVRSVRNLYSIDTGVETAGIAVIDVVARSDMTSIQKRQTIERIQEGIAELPGVASVSAAMKIPLRGGGNSFGILVEGREDRTFTYFRLVTADYFKTMGIRLKDGRVFDSSDRPPPPPPPSATPAAPPTPGTTPASPPPAIPIVINEALAKKYFPGVNPIGRTVGGGYGVPERIIGIVENVAEAALTDTAESVRYYLAGTAPWWGNAATIVARTTRPGDEVALLEPARGVLQKVAPEFAIQGTTTMERVMDTAVGPARQVMQLLALLSALALILGAIGIYGVISHFATRRKRDWAIRVALGLTASRVVGQVVGQGATLVAIGIVIGIVGTIAMGKLLTSFLYGVKAIDPIAFTAASLALMLIGVVAAFIPARRAGTVDPALVLREQ